MRRSAKISTSRANGGMIARSAASCSSVKPPGCFVVQLEAWIDAVDEQKRQRDVIGDTLGAHVVEERKALAVGIVEPIADLLPAVVDDRQRALDEFRRIQDIEIRAC